MAFFQEWLLGVKTAWREAKEQSQGRSGRAQKKDDRLRRLSSRSLNVSKPTIETMMPLEATDNKPSVHLGAEDLVTAPSTESRSFTHRSLDRPILNDEFLRELDEQISIAVGPKRETNIGIMDGSPVYSQRSSARRKASPTPRYAVPHRTKRSHASVSAAIDIEDVIRARKRVRQLEEELEIAQAELSMYTSSLASFTLPEEQISSIETQTEAIHDVNGMEQPSAEDECLQERIEENRNSASPRPMDDSHPDLKAHVPRSTSEVSTSSQDSLHNIETPRRVGLANPRDFVLSPCDLGLSPVKLNVEDFSNGEIARKDAVQALKKRMKISID